MLLSLWKPRNQRIAPSTTSHVLKVWTLIFQCYKLLQVLFLSWWRFAMHLALATNSSIHEKGATIFGLVILTRRTWHATLQATEPNRTTQQHITVLTVLTAPNVTRHLVTPLVTSPRSLFDMWCRFPCPSLGCAAFPKVLGPAPVPGSGLSDARDALDKAGQNGTGPQVETS